MNRESAILDWVRTLSAQRGFDANMVLMGEAVALRSYAKGASAHRAAEDGINEAARMPTFRPG